MKLTLVPRTDEFYALFADAGTNAHAAAKLVEQRFRQHPEAVVDQASVKDLEHVGDRLTASLILLLNTQYVTPFDREDIYGLARAIDDVVDHIEHASDLLGLYKVDATMEQSLEQCRLLVVATNHLSDALAGLRRLEEVPKHLEGVKQSEDAGDRVVRDAIAALFEDEDVSPRVIIQWKDIFEALEGALDACDGAAHLIGNIAVKSA